MSLSLRPITPDDGPFLYRVYASTRSDEMALLTWWDEAQKTQFLQMQFAAQHAHYQRYYADAAFDLILLDGEPVGRLYVGRWPEELRIVDVALLPEYRGRGLGTTLLRGLLAEGAASGRPVSIHVERTNPALRLYERLGFRLREDKGIYLLLAWEPERATRDSVEGQRA